MKRKIDVLVRAIVPVICLMMAVSFSTTELQAQDYGGGGQAKRDGGQKKKERKTRKAQSMSEKVYNKLTEAQELIEEKQYEQG